MAKPAVVWTVPVHVDRPPAGGFVVPSLHPGTQVGLRLPRVVVDSTSGGHKGNGAD